MRTYAHLVYSHTPKGTPMFRLPLDAEFVAFGVKPSGEVELSAGKSFRDSRTYWAGTIHKPHPDVPKEELERLREAYRNLWLSRRTTT